MTDETTTNDAQNMDNTDSQNSLLSEATAVDVTPEATEQTTQPDGEYDYIPSKFMNEDGQPDYEKLATSYTELEKKIGGKIGVESANDYSYEWGDGENAEELANDEAYQGIVGQLFELGLSQDQFAGVMSQFEESATDIINQLVTTPEQANEQLLEAWGNDYDTNLTLAATAFETFAPEGMDINSQSFSDPVVLELLAAIGAELGEDTRPVNSNQPASGMTQTEIEDLMKTEDYYTNPDKLAKVEAYFNSKNS